MLPHSLRHLRDRIHFVKYKSEAIFGSMGIMLIDDENTLKTSLSYSTPVGYFNEQRNNTINGVANAIATTILQDNFYKNRDLIELGTEVKGENSFWSCQVAPSSLSKDAQTIWQKISNFKHTEFHQAAIDALKLE